jgi:hypothetical protein
MATPFDIANFDFSKKAQSVAAQRHYEKAFGRGRLVKTDYRKLDQDYSIDGIWISSGGDTYSIQERFRRTKYAHYRELTVTDFKHGTENEGSWRKIQANYFVYGYFEPNVGFKELVICSVDAIKNSGIEPTTQYYKRKNLTFLCYPIDELIAKDTTIYHYRR